jgi:hypothetical protein
MYLEEIDQFVRMFNMVGACWLMALWWMIVVEVAC